MKEDLQRCETNNNEDREAQIDKWQVGDAPEHRVRIPGLGFLSLG